MQPKYNLGEKVRILTPLSKIKWGKIHQIQPAKLNLSIVQKFQHPETTLIYWVKMGTQGYLHGFMENELEKY